MSYGQKHPFCLPLATPGIGFVEAAWPLWQLCADPAEMHQAPLNGK